MGSIKQSDDFEYLEIIFEQGDFALAMPCPNRIKIQLEREWTPGTQIYQQKIDDIEEWAKKNKII